MTARLVIFGTGDIARLAAFYFEREGRFEVAGFTVDEAFLHDSTFCGRAVVPFEEVEQHFPPTSHAMFIAVSYNQMNALRAERYRQARALGYTLPSYISPHCTLLTKEPIGDNCFILEDNTIQPFVRIGSNVTLWSGNHIGHDSVIEDHVFIASHVVVSGHCRIREYAFLGVNATIAHGVTIAARTLVGAGAVITRDTEEGRIYVPPRSTVVPGKSSDEARL